jgi:hypothetical protein
MKRRRSILLHESRNGDLFRFFKLEAALIRRPWWILLVIARSVSGTFLTQTHEAYHKI